MCRLNAIRRVLRALSLGLVLAVFVTEAGADGKVFAIAAQAEVEIPDQQALIHYADGVESLVIETRFRGSGEEFAWVVPLPAVPEISPVTAGLFPTLAYLLRSAVIEEVPPYSLLAIGVFVGLALGLARRHRALTIYFGILTVLVILYMLIPNFVGVRGVADAPAASIIVHDRRIVGDYETTTISSDKSGALVDWLQGNGFGVDPAANPVIADYVQAGWVFVAVKLRRGADTAELTTPHPLAFKFPTSQPVYPLRLTATQGKPVRIDLYVFSSERAEVPGFEVRECRECEYRPSYPLHNPTDWAEGAARKGLLPVVHPRLVELVRDSQVATKLSATLSPAQMGRDAHLSWRPFERARHKVYSHRGATLTVLNFATPVICVGWLVLIHKARRRHRNSRSVWRYVGVWTVGAIVASAAAYLMWPTVDVRRLTILDHKLNSAAHRWLQSSLSKWVLEPSNGWNIQQAEQFVATAHGSKNLANCFLGGRIREEDSPGNYTLRTGTTGFEYLYYDEFGNELLAPLELPAPNSGVRVEQHRVPFASTQQAPESFP